MSGTVKPRVRVPAGRSFTGDSFSNFLANVGIGQNNIASGARYGFYPITRQRLQLDWMYRGSWIVRQIIDAVADDMTRAGVSFTSDMPPDEVDQFHNYLKDLLVWQRLNDAIKWSRLYGGAIAVILIEGQDTATPLRVDTVGRNQFVGLLALDRWMLQPTVSQYIERIGPDLGLPEFYDVVSGIEWAAGPLKRIHHTRAIRLIGVDLPYWQRMTENDWGMSVVEPLFDRLAAFDSATQGAAQLVYRAHLRTLKLPRLRELIAMGGPVYQAMLSQIETIRMLQSNEGITLLDGDDEFETYQYSFSGLSDVLIQFCQQLSGAAQIPLTRLFGQSPAGMNATGESDMRNYYDAINAQQEAKLRRPIGTVLEVAYRSRFGKPLPDGFDYTFAPLWQMSDPEKAQVAGTIATAVNQSFQEGVLTRDVALKELRQSARITGIFSNITDEQIAEAEQEPTPMELQQQQMEMAAAGGMPGEPGAGGGQERSGADEPDPRTANPLLSANGTQPRQNGSNGAHPDVNRFMVSRIARAHTQDQSVLPLREVAGIEVVIETREGDMRQGDGWQCIMPADYGYIRGTNSAEGPWEQMDCFVGHYPEADKAYIIEQHNLDDNSFDEHKVMLAYPRQEDAIADYVNAFSDGRGAERVGSITEVSLPQLREWLAQFRNGQPFTPVAT